jgi:tetratricopeptide (TPR) repeat protein
MSADDLKAALEHHRAGRLPQAVALYHRLLAADPSQPDVLHLAGMAALQQGDARKAIDLITRAVALKPGTAAYLCNLGEAFRAAGNAAKAADCLRTALRLQPAYPQAANNLGLALQAQGRLAESAEQFRAAVNMNPRYASAHNNLANALRLLNDRPGALDHYRLAAQAQPDSAEAHSNLGQMLLETGHVDEALVHCRRSVELRPNFAEAHSNLGNVLREQGDLSHAKACYRRALALKPGLAMAYNNLGQALQEEGDLEGAVSCYHQALAREPDSARFHTNLASALDAAERYAEAAERYRKAIQCDPAYAGAHNGLGFALDEMGELAEAETHLREAIRLEPDLAAAHVNLGNVQQQLGRLPAAEDCFRQAILYKPDYAVAHGQLATLLRGRLPDEDLRNMQSLLEGGNASEAGGAALHFGLAHVLDARGQFDLAAEHLRQANALQLAGLRKRGRSYRADDHTTFVDNMIAACTPQLFERTRGLGSESQRPIFVIGLPRSGTTLTEQILASHSQVFGAGELRFGRQDFEGLPAALGCHDAPFECLPKLDGTAIGRLAQTHLVALADLDERAPNVVDKMPDNYLYLGLLQILFPRARFIHVRRDLRDTAVSCWMTNFKQIRWACDEEHIARRFADYQRLMTHWRGVLPEPLLEVDYEETVADVERVARRLVEWCGLAWEPQCLAFHETARPVRTASVSQVRQPIYARSVQRWRNYQPSLASLFARLPSIPE